MSGIAKTRGSLYRAARLLGDGQAIASGDPATMAKRVARKALGRKMGSLMRFLR